MKKLSLALCSVLLISLSAFAYFDLDYDNNNHNGYGNNFNSGLRCQATDDGWEEHFGGHSSCGACLREHQDCTMRCYEDQFTAVAEGRNQYGELETVTAMDRDRLYAGERALDRCYSQRLSNCRIVDTDTDSRLVRSERCAGYNNNNGGGHNTCSYQEYYRRRPDVRASGMDALTHYNRHGKNEGMCRPVR